MSTFSELIEDYRTGPTKLRNAVAGMTSEQLQARPVPGKWSTLEVICHLADFEPVYVDRMKRVITHDHPLLMGADQELYAAKLAYQERDIEEELAVIETTRKQFARILKTLPADALKRTGVHSERGLNTLEDLLQCIINHIQHHLPFIEEKRRALQIRN
jgi:uncharacterized damage-inducible protein DinB